MQSPIMLVLSWCFILLAIGYVIYLCIYPPLTAEEELQKIISNLELEHIRTKLDELQSKEILGYCFSNGEYSVILSRHLRESKPKWAWYISNKNDLESFLTYLNN